MLRKLRSSMHQKFGRIIDVTENSDYLWSEELSELRRNNEA